MKLYSYWRSTSAWRVRLALHWKGLAFEYVAVNLLEGQQWAPEHRARSHMGKIPVLEVEGRHLSESMAIIHFIEETHPEPPLLPRDPWQRAQARMLAEMVNSGIQPMQNLAVQKYLKKIGSDEKQWIESWVGGGLADLEHATAGSAGRFCVGDQVSLADIYLVPQLAWARRNQLDLSALATLNRIDQACAALPAFQAAAAENQPDSP